MLKVKIVGDGYPESTYVIDTETGKIIPGFKKFTWQSDDNYNRKVQIILEAEVEEIEVKYGNQVDLEGTDYKQIILNDGDKAYCPECGKIGQIHLNKKYKWESPKYGKYIWWNSVTKLWECWYCGSSE